MFTIEDINKIVSRELGEKESVINDIHRSQYEFVKVACLNEASVVKLTYIGKFVFKTGYLEHWKAFRQLRRTNPDFPKGMTIYEFHQLPREEQCKLLNTIKNDS